MPSEILNGSRPSQGVILFNHYTMFNSNEAPTLGYAPVVSILLTNPLMPDYIVVESDFYGIGATVRFPQASSAPLTPADEYELQLREAFGL